MDKKDSAPYADRLAAAIRQFADRFPWSEKRRAKNPSNRENEDQETEFLFYVLERLGEHAREYGNPCVVAVPDALTALAYDFWRQRWKARGRQNNRPLQPDPKRLMQHWRDKVVRKDAVLPQDRGKDDAKRLKDTLDGRFDEDVTDDGFWLREDIDDRPLGVCRVVVSVVARDRLLVVYATFTRTDSKAIADAPVPDETDVRVQLPRRSTYRDLDDFAEKLSGALIEAPIDSYEYAGERPCVVRATKKLDQIERYPKKRIGLRYGLVAGSLFLLSTVSVLGYELYPPFRTLVDNAIAAIRSSLRGQRVGPISTLNDASAHPGQRNEPWRSLEKVIGRPQSGVDPGEIARAMYETLVRTAPMEDYEPPKETDVELLSPNVIRAVVSEGGDTSTVQFIAHPNPAMPHMMRTRNAPIRYSFGVYEVTSAGDLQLVDAEVGRPEFSLTLQKPHTYFISLVMTQVMVATPAERAGFGYDVIRAKHGGAAFLVFDHATNRHVFRPAELRSESSTSAFSKGTAPGRFTFEGDDNAVRSVADPYWLAPALAQLSDYAETMPGCAAGSVQVRAPGEVVFAEPTYALPGNDYRVACFDTATGAMETWDDARGKREVLLRFKRPGTYGCAAIVMANPKAIAPGRSHVDLQACWSKVIITPRH